MLKVKDIPYVRYTIEEGQKAFAEFEKAINNMEIVTF